MKTCDAETTAVVQFSNMFLSFWHAVLFGQWQGPNYTSRLMQALCKLCHISQFFSTSYITTRVQDVQSSLFPQFWRRLVYIVLLVSSNDWSSKLDAVLLSYRALKSTITHRSQFEVLFSTQMRLPIDTSVLSEIDMSPDVDTYVRKAVQKVELTRENAKAAHNNANERSKFFYDRHAAYIPSVWGRPESFAVRRNNKTGRKP